MSKAKTFAAKINHVWIKFYSEQCVDCSYDDKGVSTDTPERQRELINNVLANIMLNIPCDDWAYHSVCHYKDSYTEVDSKLENFATKIKTPSAEKPHGHLLLFSYRTDKAGHFKRVRLGTIIDWLKSAGLVFRDGLDDSLLTDFQYTDRKKHGISNIITYHKHETLQARDCDGKEQYSNDECITSLTASELQEYLDEYKRVFELKQDAPPTKLREQKEHLYKQAFDLGYSLGNFPKFWGDIARDYGANLTYNKLLEGYNSGVEKFCTDNYDKTFPVCPIFIQSAPNQFKSRTCALALSRLVGADNVFYPSNNSGAFDELAPHHQALVFDDFNHRIDILNVCDTGTYSKRVYRRGSHNPHILCKYVIFTHNSPLNEYISEYYSELCTNQLAFNAVKSRFFQIHITPDGRVLSNAKYLRGCGTYKEDVEKLFADFLGSFLTARDEILRPTLSIGDLDEFETVNPS